MTQEHPDEAIERRTKNAEAGFVWLLSVYEYIWIAVGSLFLLALGLDKVFG